MFKPLLRYFFSKDTSLAAQETKKEGEFVEQREHPRIPHCLRVISPEISNFQATTMDLSAVGLRIVSTEPIEPGKEFTLSLDIGVFPIRLKAESRWCTPGDAVPYHVGICLRNSSANNLRAISNFVDQELRLLESEPSEKMKTLNRAKT